MSAVSFLNSYKFNNKSLSAPGVVDPSQGGYTVSNAPFIFANLMRELQKPGGPLSSLATNRIFAGEAESLISQGRARKQNTLRSLQLSGMNEAQAMAQIQGSDQETLSGISSLRSAREGDLQKGLAEAQTQLASVLSQSEDVQKTREEQLRQFEKIYSQLKRQQKFNQILGIAGLALQFFPEITAPLRAAFGVGLNKAGGALGGDFGKSLQNFGQQAMGNDLQTFQAPNAFASQGQAVGSSGAIGLANPANPFFGASGGGAPSSGGFGAGATVPATAGGFGQLAPFLALLQGGGKGPQAQAGFGGLASPVPTMGSVPQQQAGPGQQGQAGGQPGMFIDPSLLANYLANLPQTQGGGYFTLQLPKAA